MQNLTPLPPDQCPPIPDFTPVPRKYRRDGWTPDRQRAFIEALAATGSVTAAAARINMSTEGAYYLRRQPGAEEFAAAWAAALDHGVQHLTDLAIDRAVHGVAVPVFWRGEQVGEKRWFNDRLLMFILKHHMPARYGASLPATPRSRAQIEQEAADNCPNCRTRAEQEAQAAAQAEEDEEAYPGQWLDELLRRYEAKVESERMYRLDGRVAAADFTVRQLTHLELVLTMGGRSDAMLDMWSNAEGKRPNPASCAPTLFADPFSQTLDDIRHRVWAADGGLERPILPHHHRTCVQTTEPLAGDTQVERTAARRAARLRIAEAQAEWEAAWTEESWAEWRAGGRRLSEA